MTRSRSCCCLPVRFGVFVIALLGLFGGSLVAAAGIISLKNTGSGKATLVIQVVIYIVLTLISIFGLMGAIMKRRRLIAIYWAMLTAHLLFSIVSGAFALNALFKDAPANLEKCIDGSQDPKVASDCKKAISLIKGGMVALLIIAWLVQIYGCIIVDRYTSQLREEEDAMFKEESGRPTW